MMRFTRARVPAYEAEIAKLTEDYALGTVTHVGVDDEGSVAFWGDTNLCLLFQPGQVEEYCNPPGDARWPFGACPEEYVYEDEDFTEEFGFYGTPADDVFEVGTSKSLY